MSFADEAPNSNRLTQYLWTIYVQSKFYSYIFLKILRCPSCKTSDYVVEYWATKKQEEKGIEQDEE